MKTVLLRGLLIAAAACLSTAQADHMSPHLAGWANMPNDIHNTRFETRGDNEEFLDFIRYGEGADSVNRFLIEETAAIEDELAAGHQIVRLAARLDPLPGFLGGGWARYTLLDGDPAVSRVLNINVRLRLVRPNGAVANEALGLTADNAADATVSAYFRRYDGTDYAGCGLVFEGLVLGDDEVADYAVYGLSLKADQAGLIEGSGACAGADGFEPLLPEVQGGDVVDIGVLMPAMTEEVVPVLMGGF
ncbi:MAG: hypothetical protein MUC77_17855 [Chromatiaceae bacterium]|jgi:hypothetical protein|nr:hypothetical protein [Chromatiaceae bacterium]